MQQTEHNKENIGASALEFELDKIPPSGAKRRNVLRLYELVSRLAGYILKTLFH